MKFLPLLFFFSLAACNSTLDSSVAKSPPSAGNFDSALRIYADCLSESAGAHMSGSRGLTETQVINKSLGDCRKSGMQAAEFLLDEEATDLPIRYHDYSHAKKFALPIIEQDGYKFLQNIIARSQANA